MDREGIDDAIRHFAGALELVAEAGRARPAFDEFTAPRTPDPLLDDIVARAVEIAAPFALDDVTPGILYEPLWDVMPPLSLDQREFTAPSPLAPPPPAELPSFLAPFPPASVGSAPVSVPASDFVLPPAPLPPGSVAMVGRQVNGIVDHDVFVGPEGLDPADHAAWLSGLREDAATVERLEAAVAPVLPAFAPPASEAALVDMVNTAAETLARLAEGEPPADGTIVTGAAAWASRQDGAAVTDVLIRPAHEEADAPEHGVSTGGNIAASQAIVFDAWVDATTYIVAGDYVSVDMISQTNVVRDVDTGAVSTAGFGADDATNIATIVAISNPGPATAESAPQFAANWNVTRLETNLVSATWLEQVNVIVDGDLVSSTAQSTRLDTGGNQALDVAVLQTLGMFFDLIVVAGDMVHANIILQRNVLLDDDRAPIDGTGIAGADVGATFADTGGNAVWNEASITIVGTVTALGLEAGQDGVLDTFASGGTPDPAAWTTGSVTGVGPLNVLYVEGDFIDVTFVTQTNVVSDGDTLLGTMLAGDTIETGGNELVNVANVIDYGTDSTIHIGGAIYSDALIHQAELIEGGADSGVAMAPLVSEAVAFLTDGSDPALPDDGPHTIVATQTETASVDVMQSMTG